MTRSTRLLAVGITVLVAALVLLLVAQRNEPDPIVVADDTPDVTATATDGAAADGAEDTGTVGALADDASRLPAPLQVPEGHEAVAVSSTYDAAVAGLPVPGDRVNLYAVFQQGVPDALHEDSGDGTGAGSAGKGAIRTLSGVEVLGVTGVAPEAGGGSVTLVLALEPDAAERTIYLAAAEQVWFSLVGPDHAPVDGEGVTRETVLDDLS